MTRDHGIHILQLYHDCGPGGAEQLILSLCCWLRRQGHRVTVATCREGWLAEHLRANHITTRVFPQRRWLDLKRILEIVRLAEDEHVDVLHAHEFPMTVALAPAARLKRFPMVATLHGGEHILANGRRRIALRVAAGFCHQVVGVSQAVRHLLVQDVRIPSEKVQTIYNGIALNRYEGTTVDRDLRCSLGISPTARVIGTIGSLYPVKGQTYLLQAMAHVVSRFPEAVCLVAGRGELLHELRDEAADLHLSDHVRFLGFRTDVPELLRLMEVFVLPSLSEGLPLCLLEAQAAGKPVVASEVGGIPEIVADGATGYLVPPADPRILADRIVRLLADPANARAMGEFGRQRVQRNFSLESMAEAYLSLYTGCVNARHMALAS